MDPISHGAIGVGWARCVAPRQNIAAAVIVGAVSGMAPDLDVLIGSSSDPLLFLEYHRQFSHALAFIPVGALLCAAALRPLLRRHLEFRYIYLIACLGYGSHGLLDACTTYGTQLLWPFSTARIAWNNVSVVDPLFTIPVIVLLAQSWRRRSPLFARIALCWAALYLGLGLLQTVRASSAATALALSRGHVPTRVATMPAIASLLLWKTIYLDDGRYYVDAVRIGWNTIVYPGGVAVRLDREAHFPWLDASSTQAMDLERFRRFADDWLAIDDEAVDTVVDMRFSMLPNEADALWGIRLDPDAGRGDHVQFVTDPAIAPGRAKRLLRMFLGLPPPAESGQGNP